MKQIAKKYPTLKNDLTKLFESLAIAPVKGTALGNNFYKIRLSIASENKGKSGGERVVTYIKAIETTIYLSSIYDKSERSTIMDKELI